MNHMMRTIKIFALLLSLTALLPRCVQTYVSPYKSPSTGYLVVEGYISGNSPTQFTLSRTIPLPGDSAIPAVTGATVQVEGSDNSINPLGEVGNGVYADSLTLDPTAKYRLRISIPGGETYLSDFVTYKTTPAIDSINWTENGPSGVTIYANAHDVTNSTRYYQWQYTQTYQYYSGEQSGYIYNASTDSLNLRPASEQIYKCWITTPSFNILIGSSAKLAQDVIYEYPLVQIPANSRPLSALYSILVRQYALTDSGYIYLSLMQLNTESLGSIFDVQPSQPLGGNIHSLSNPGEIVVGYISAGSVQSQRIFISRDQVPDWLYIYRCGNPDVTVPNNPDSIHLYFGELGYLAIGMANLPPPGAYLGNVSDCVDCRFQGGTTQMPSFWPN
jgi:hypothetical protein